MVQSEHFRRAELASSQLSRMDANSMKVLEDVRRIYDKLMTLSSAFRDLSNRLGFAVDVLEGVLEKELKEGSV